MLPPVAPGQPAPGLTLQAASPRGAHGRGRGRVRPTARPTSGLGRGLQPISGRKLRGPGEREGGVRAKGALLQPAAASERGGARL